jgi:hypothetical protein
VVFTTSAHLTGVNRIHFQCRSSHRAGYHLLSVTGFDGGGLQFNVAIWCNPHCLNVYIIRGEELRSHVTKLCTRPGWSWTQDLWHRTPEPQGITMFSVMNDITFSYCLFQFCEYVFSIRTHGFVFILPFMLDQILNAHESWSIKNLSDFSFNCI